MLAAIYTLMWHSAFCVLFLNVCSIRTAGGLTGPKPEEAYEVPNPRT